MGRWTQCLGGSIHRPVVCYRAKKVDTHPTPTIPVPSVIVSSSLVLVCCGACGGRGGGRVGGGGEIAVDVDEVARGNCQRSA